MQLENSEDIYIYIYTTLADNIEWMEKELSAEKL